MVPAVPRGQRLVAAYQAQSTPAFMRKVLKKGFVDGYLNNICPTTMVHIARRVGAIFRRVTLRASPDSRMTFIMRTYREYRAALAALDIPEDLVMIWHPAHFPGIVDVLGRNGYELTDTDWQLAVRDPFAAPAVDA